MGEQDFSRREACEWLRGIIVWRGGGGRNGIFLKGQNIV